MIKAIQDLCDHCGSCTSVCPSKSILVGTKKQSLYLIIDHKTCTNCYKCLRICPVKAIVKTNGKKSTGGVSCS